MCTNSLKPASSQLLTKILPAFLALIVPFAKEALYLALANSQLSLSPSPIAAISLKSQLISFNNSATADDLFTSFNTISMKLSPA